MANFESIPLSDVKRLRDLPHRSANEALKLHSNLAVKLSETTAEFIQKLATAEDQHGQHLANIVRSFRKKTQDHLKSKDPDSLFWSGTHFTSWESLLTQVEEEAKASSDFSQNMMQSVNQQLLELTTKKKQLIKRWFLFRETYMSRVDKTEDHVDKLFREYQDQWTRYGEAAEKAGGDNVKDSVILHSYNSHNDYVLSKCAFNSLHEEFYGKQIYDMLDELQAVHEDLVKGYRTCMHKQVQLGEEKLNASLSRLTSFLETVNSINAPADISSFISGQNVAGKVYPPPKSEFKSPEVPTPKNPESPPIDLPPLTDDLQLVDMTQAPLSHAQETLKQKEFDLSSDLEKLHTEYQSVKTLLDSYRENPQLGDPNSLIEELLDMRNRVRVKEAELVMVRGKISLFLGMASDQCSESGIMRQSLIEDSSLSGSIPGRPRKSSETFVTGRSHDFVESTSKFPVLCKYCDGMIQPPISKGLRCKVCKLTVHHKCEKYIPYCSGLAPVKASPKFSKVPKRISMMLTKKLSTDSASSKSPGSPESMEDDDDTIGGIYEPPPPAPLPPKPNDRMRKSASPTHAPVPKPPPRGESLETSRYSTLEDVFVHNSFEDTLELADSYSYCVALFDYAKQNPNDMEIQCGEVIELINTASSDWWKGSTGGKKGYFPATYVQLVSHGDTVMRALYDFSPQGKGEIPLEEGQIIVMTRNDGDGWLFGKSGEQEGLFPANYVEKVKTI